MSREITRHFSLPTRYFWLRLGEVGEIVVKFEKTNSEYQVIGKNGGRYATLHFLFESEDASLPLWPSKRIPL